MTALGDDFANNAEIGFRRNPNRQKLAVLRSQLDRLLTPEQWLVKAVVVDPCRRSGHHVLQASVVTVLEQNRKLVLPQLTDLVLRPMVNFYVI